MQCQWYNGFTAMQASGKGLQALHDGTGSSDSDYATLACAAYAYFYKSGYTLCKAYDLTAYALFRSSSAKGNTLSNAKLDQIAATAAQKYVGGFDRKTWC